MPPPDASKLSTIKDSLPEFMATPLNDIPSIVNTLREHFHGHDRKTIDINFRRIQLQRLYWGLIDVEPIIKAALQVDLGRAEFESQLADLDFTKGQLLDIINNLDKWTREEGAADIPFLMKGHRCTIRKDPLGVVLVIGAWNYPWNLCLLPFIGAMAAGNTVLLKPSEVSPNCAAVLGKLFEVSGIDRNCYKVVQGGVAETTLVLKQQFDKICYTGNGAVGKIVYRAAAEFLTPVLLELGGKNPTFILPSADIELAGKRIAWAKGINSGQSCTAPDYLLVHRSQEDAFIASFKAAVNAHYPNGVARSPDYSRIVNGRHFSRISLMLKSSGGEIVAGGKEINEKEFLMEPTLVRISSENDSLMQDEIFGPVLPYIVYDSLSEAVAIAQRKSDTSLGCYVFGNDKTEIDYVLKNTRSGGVCINEAFYNTIVGTLPFGGVGQSGTGCYRGRYSIEAFVHRRPVLGSPRWVDWLIGMRYPPYTDWAWKQLGWGTPKPWFGREKL